MQRHATLDPPEYLDWNADPAAVVAAWDATLARDPARAARVAALGPVELETLYARLLRARLHDQQLARWVRQGVLSKAWLATGEEATTTGPVYALDPARDVVAPVIRNQSACLDFGMPLADVFRAMLGTPDAASAGRDLHIGDWPRRILAPVSQMGTMAAVTTGVALAMQRQGTGGVALTWIGDGAAKTGVAHEALTLAGVRRVPAVFILQDNGIALGTVRARHHAADDFRAWGAMYGITSAPFDGNHVLDAWAATAEAVARCRAGEGPVLLVAETFRMGGHATHDEAEARRLIPAETFARWGARDPVAGFECWLAARGIRRPMREAVEARVAAEVAAAAEAALASRALPHRPEALLAGERAATCRPGTPPPPAAA